MGNNQSGPQRDRPAGGHPSSTASTPSTTAGHEPRRRDSIHKLSSSKATAAPPSESLTSATAHVPSRSRPLPHHTRHRSEASAIDKSRSRLPAERTLNDSSQQKSEAASARATPPSPSSKPMQVPGSNDGSRRTDSRREPPRLTEDQDSLPPSQISRPPRLPLPIEEELHTPGSPIISAEDLSSALDRDAIEGALPRRTSVLSSTTVDEDDIGDDLQNYPVDRAHSQAIPTLIEWKQGGDKVYVTGTFANWNRKFRLHKEPGKQSLSAVLQLPPGTHHLKFIVDGEMRTSDDLPTAVDYTNILVNYIELSAEDVLPPPASELQEQETQQQETPTAQPPKVPSTAPDVKAPDPSSGAISEAVPSEGPTPPPKKYTSEIPRFLLDLERPEDSPQYQRAAAAASSLPPPPSLPLFLGKSILNNTTPMKDDSSVLSMPNHTVLNHLATSSIKNNVLATSATTRYKRKYVSTILYKPTNDAGD
ncbi:carbohydrate-binding module family 48 protein [Xylona heveae TC161]|uniref:Carbohydrate-binding module family 48 protein n=1 Tax=Xylona heveae (strain CBS 132557 / TC161) TaxID=1328760 RepID=A0A165GVY8_XYLHT|nr:carbohydrate-binding module family 48 protein [Xylona heveae TC161]KZF22665.1 carbohydrate-binding module family 48 protein [Xylona heveae TC161]